MSRGVGQNLKRTEQNSEKKNESDFKGRCTWTKAVFGQSTQSHVPQRKKRLSAGVGVTKHSPGKEYSRVLRTWRLEVL
jgi:hypothetical protein